jgi:neutral ceramidase
MLSSLLMLLCSLVQTRTAEVPSTAARAGWAQVDITPPLGIGLGGRAGPDTLASRVLDPLVAQVLYLQDSRGTGFVLVSFDLIGLPHELADRIRTAIVHELGVDWNLVVLNGSHTHSGPYMLRSLMAGVDPAPPIEIDYFRALEEKLVAAARAAAGALKKVDVTVFEGKSDLAINRRGKNEQGLRGIIPDPNGAFDERVWVMKLSPAGGGDSAVVFSYACHPVLVYGFDYSAISADFPGGTRRWLREQLGSGTHAQFVQGFAGNVRPRVVADLAGGRFRNAKPDDLQRAARDLGNAVIETMKGPGKRLQLHLAGAGDRPFLPRGKPPPREIYAKLERQGLATTNRYQLGVSRYWLKRYDSGEGFARGDAWSLGLIRLADNQWVVYSAGEPCVEWREKIAKWLAPMELVTWGYSEAKSYLPTESMLPEGGYEVIESNQARASTPAPYAPGIERAVRESLLRQLAFLRADPESAAK